MNLRRNAAIIASLMLSGLMPIPAAGEQQTGSRQPIPGPYFPPPKREPPPLTPEQIKAQEKRARKAAKQKEQTNGT